MNGNVELLDFIYQNSQMGVETMDQLGGMAEEGPFKDFLKKQRQEYLSFHKRAKELLWENGYDEKGLGAFEKIRTYLMVNMQTMMDKSPSHMAEMLITGSTMGITDAVKKIRQYQGAEKHILDLMEDLRKFEENSVEKLKEFL